MQRKNPWLTSTEIHASLKESGMAISACTIRRYLNKNEPHGKVARKKAIADWFINTTKEPTHNMTDST